MNPQLDVQPGLWKRTFSLDLLRSLPMGCVETAGMTFVMFIAAGVLNVSDLAKMTIIAGNAAGLLSGIFVVAFVRRTGMPVTVSAAIAWFLAAIGYALAALWPEQTWVYVGGTAFAGYAHAIASPLFAQIYRHHYPSTIRGKLFSAVGLLRAITAALFAWFVGLWLDGNLDSFALLFWGFAACSVIKAALTLAMKPVYLRKANKLSLLDSFSHLKHDKVFRKLISSWMFLGLGNLICMALFVEYITNDHYGWGLGAKQVSAVTAMIPMFAFLGSVYFWGMIYDKMEFYRLRLIVNIFFILGVVIYYTTGSYLGLCVGIALHGIGKAGGTVLWSLWTTKFAPADKVNEYMSVHTFFTGVRGLISAFAAFPVARWLGPDVLGWMGGALMFLSSCMLIPEVKQHWGRK